jgi:hypothetical protein
MFANFGADVLGAPIWEPQPNFLGGHADTSKMTQLAPLPATNLGTPVEML